MDPLVTSILPIKHRSSITRIRRLLRWALLAITATVIGPLTPMDWGRPLHSLLRRTPIERPAHAPSRRRHPPSAKPRTTLDPVVHITFHSRLPPTRSKRRRSTELLTRNPSHSPHRPSRVRTTRFSSSHPTRATTTTLRTTHTGTSRRWRTSAMAGARDTRGSPSAPAPSARASLEVVASARPPAQEAAPCTAPQAPAKAYSTQQEPASSSCARRRGPLGAMACTAPAQAWAARASSRARQTRSCESD
jgi:hypothetical protein